ncbi:MAG: type III-B CRISPR module-associated protein Cmr3 [Acidobacteria bacterium]|nr:type III-B CRISPR module-associated protein Cmr3 [Acidobacteriota bacterium]
MSFHLRVEPHDPLIARDGRPFGAAEGGRMKTVDWLYPSVLAGTVRTLLGELAGLDFQRLATIQALNGLAVHGPIAARNGQLFVAPPKDCVRHPKTGMYYAARPRAFEQDQGWDLAAPGLLPVLLPDELREDFKPERPPALWSMKAAADWLGNPPGGGFSVDSGDKVDKLDTHERTHVKIEAGSGAAEEGKLFTTTGIEFPSGLHMSARVGADEIGEPLRRWSGLHSMGGERRLSRFSVEPGDAWNCPEGAAKALGGSTRIRMQLVTPAIFSAGWRPEWITRREQTGEELTLVSAAMDRWRPISGWSYVKPCGPKAVRRMVPAGSVYFFTAKSAPKALNEFWLAPVSDLPQDRRDGFGLAIWGVW